MKRQRERNEEKKYVVRESETSDIILHLMGFGADLFHFPKLKWAQNIMCLHKKLKEDGWGEV